MSDRMSVSEYRKLMAREVSGGAMSDDEFQKTLKNQQLDHAKKINDKPRNHEEDDLSMQVAGYLELLKMKGKVVCFTHTPQETYTKSWAVKNKNTEMGVRAGIPDFVIVFPTGVFFLELKKGDEKTGSYGRPTPSQIMWLEAIQQVYSLSGGVTADIAYGWKQAKNQIDIWAETFGKRRAV